MVRGEEEEQEEGRERKRKEREKVQEGNEKNTEKNCLVRENERSHFQNQIPHFLTHTSCTFSLYFMHNTCTGQQAGLSIMNQYGHIAEVLSLKHSPGANTAEFVESKP